MPFQATFLEHPATFRAGCHGIGYYRRQNWNSKGGDFLFHVLPARLRAHFSFPKCRAEIAHQ